MRADQIAYVCIDAAQERALKKSLGLLEAEWIEDIVIARSIVNGVEGKNTARLHFNYSLGIELEILQYISGRSWHDDHPNKGFDIFTSHVGFHLDDGEPFPAMEDFPLVQETFTLEHSGKYLTDPSSPGYGRKYHYRIHELAPGSYMKFIRRVYPK